MNRITSRTLVPLGLSIIVIGSAAGWATKVSMEIEAHANSIAKTEVMNTDIYNHLHDIKTQLSVIESKVIILERRKKCQ